MLFGTEKETKLKLQAHLHPCFTSETKNILIWHLTRPVQLCWLELDPNNPSVRATIYLQAPGQPGTPGMYLSRQQLETP